MKRERVVFDTNVLISAFLSVPSTPARALETAVTVDEPVGTAETHHELMLTLLSPKFDRYLSIESRDALLFRMSQIVETIEVTQSIRGSRDPRDDKFLEAAINGRADILVTGDGDLLELHPFRGVAILSPADYLVRKLGG
jgi:putative PIN family toxin of toxin-antitoxin system